MDESEIDVAKTLSDCITMMEIRALNSEINIEVDCPDHLPALLADGRHVRQIMINLLSNAIKFTPTGGHIKVSAGLDDDSSMTIVVFDTGIGIPASDISKILLPFGQVGYLHVSDHGGTGLGLTISKALMELHDGTLTIESEVGEGTTVALRFPPERTIQT